MAKTALKLATGDVGSHDTAEAARTPANARGGHVCVAAGNDAEQFAAAFLLWQGWCREEYGRGLDEEAWNQQQRQKLAGPFVQVVAWDGCVPVGMVEVHMSYDPAARTWTGAGDKAFVAKAYRREGVYRALIEGAEATAALLGAEEYFAPVGVGQRADWLAQAYERRGYRRTGLMYRRTR